MTCSTTTPAALEPFPAATPEQEARTHELAEELDAYRKPEYWRERIAATK